jgi:uroporphyrinogen III methyltransferase/synthase
MIARSVLPERLREQGAEVEVIPVYETTLPLGSRTLLKRTLGEDSIDLITFTSSSTVRNFVKLAEDMPLSAYDCAAIGPITADTAVGLGLHVVLQPSHATIPDFVNAIKEFLVHARKS